MGSIFSKVNPFKDNKRIAEAEIDLITYELAIKAKDFSPIAEEDIDLDLSIEDTINDL